MQSLVGTCIEVMWNMKTTKIKGYKIEFVVNDDSSNCYIEKGNFSSSLEVLNDFGYLESRTGAEHKVDPDTIEKIYEWALAQGY
jgi:hypothetical protein